MFFFIWFLIDLVVCCCLDSILYTDSLLGNHGGDNGGDADHFSNLEGFLCFFFSNWLLINFVVYCCLNCILYTDSLPGDSNYFSNQ